MFIPITDRLKKLDENKRNGGVTPIVDSNPSFDPFGKGLANAAQKSAVIEKNSSINAVAPAPIAPESPTKKELMDSVAAVAADAAELEAKLASPSVEAVVKKGPDLDESMTAYQRAATEILHEVLSPIRSLIDDPDVTEIMINNPRTIWYERNGIMCKFDGALTDIEMSAALKNIAGINEKEMSIAFDGKLKGIRVAAALGPVSVNGNSMCIRKHMRKGITLSDYTSRGLFDVVQKSQEQREAEYAPYELARAGGESLQKFIEWMVVTKKSILVAGATGSGKTTLMRAILGAVPSHERLITIEDTAELSLTHPNFVSFEANQEKGVALSDLVKLSLRYRPDRIIMGEVRGAEAYDLMDAFGTGHPGGCCSMHGESPLLALSRFENMLRRSPFTQNTPLHALRQDICNAFKFVIFSSDAGGSRCPEEIIELNGVGEKGEYLYKQVFKKFV